MANSRPVDEVAELRASAKARAFARLNTISNDLATIPRACHPHAHAFKPQGHDSAAKLNEARISGLTNMQSLSRTGVANTSIPGIVENRSFIG
jgi:hypothetical protein